MNGRDWVLGTSTRVASGVSIDIVAEQCVLVVHVSGCCLWRALYDMQHTVGAESDGGRAGGDGLLY